MHQGEEIKCPKCNEIDDYTTKVAYVYVNKDNEYCCTYSMHEVSQDGAAYECGSCSHKWTEYDG